MAAQAMAAQANERKCKDYLRYGRCRRGESCKYASSHGTPREVCRHFSRHGNCRFGDSCRHAHARQNPEIAAQRPLKICRKYLRHGRCKWGEFCKYGYSHGSGSTPQEASHGSGSTPREARQNPEIAALAIGAIETTAVTAADPVIARQTEGQRRCIVCASGPLEVGYSRCGHVSLCQQCSDTEDPSLNSCPICREASGRVRIRLCGM